MNELSVDQQSWMVAKFGGTSVSSADRWRNIKAVAQAHLDAKQRLFIVCSAPAHISNLLETLIKQALLGTHSAVLADIEARYRALAAELELDFSALLASDFQTLAQLIEGISLVLEVTPRLRARIMSMGELMLTKLGAAYLNARGLETAWQDAREHLLAEREVALGNGNNYLNAKCRVTYQSEMRKKLSALPAKVFITQGFIARNTEGETVLLGRGGSDVSAAFFAVQLAAEACEIWTDVPGIYTANPHQIPEARLLKRLDYDEAQEISSMGAKVLHPNCVAPLKEHQIPLYIRYTPDPNREGSLISLEGERSSIQIKSILTKSHILLITIETVRMWHQVGFLADIFSCFKKHGLSIDLITTSESSVTVSLDSGSHVKDADVIDHLLEDLNQFAKASTIGPCASISLVGHNIRAIMHKLGDVFSVFESQQVHLMSQASNDLNLTFVVDEDQAERLAKKLHVLLIEENPQSYYFSKSWQEEFGQYVQRPSPWWELRRQELLSVAKKQSPIYVYDQEALLKSIDALKACHHIKKLFYAMKANNYEPILRKIYESGLGFECVSIQELKTVLSLFPNIDRQRILFTPNFAPREEYQEAIDWGVYITIDNLHPLQYWSELFRDQEILVRIDPGQGAGHHKFVCTGGMDSKFGIPLAQIETLLTLAAESQTKIIGLHAHSGSGILQSDNWQRISNILSQQLEKFPDVRILNLGGGLGIVEKPGQSALDLESVNRSLESVKSAYPNIQLWLEPGRFFVANAGVLIAKVTQLKDKGETCFIGIETGMNSLIRPGLYGAYHEIVNLTRLEAPKKIMANIVGPICESGDTLGYSRLFPVTQEGDLILIANTGAYGRCMGSSYNMREPASEYFLTSIMQE